MKTHGALRDALADTCDRMGIRYFALSHHVDFSASPRAVRIHNYPPGWEDWYDANRLGLSDPIHRASHRTAQGFLWRDVPQLIPLTRTDRDVLARGREIGLGEGVTIPAHVPGEALGSCTFVSVADEALPDEYQRLRTLTHADDSQSVADVIQHSCSEGGCDGGGGWVAG